MPSTTTSSKTVRDGMNTNTLGKLADAMLKAPLGDILSVLLDKANPDVTVAATTVGAAVVPTAAGVTPTAAGVTPTAAGVVATAVTVATADATSPAGGAYVQAEATANADLTNALKVAVNALIVDVAALITQQAANVVDLGALSTQQAANVVDLGAFSTQQAANVVDIAALATLLNAARVDILALRAELAGALSGPTDDGLTVTSHQATLSAQPTKNGLFLVRATAGTTTGVKKLIRDPSRTLATGEVFWDGSTGLTFATVDAVTACDATYAKADLSQKASCLMQDMAVP